MTGLPRHSALVNVQPESMVIISYQANHDLQAVCSPECHLKTESDLRLNETAHLCRTS